MKYVQAVLVAILVALFPAMIGCEDTAKNAVDEAAAEEVKKQLPEVAESAVLGTAREQAEELAREAVAEIQAQGGEHRPFAEVTRNEFIKELKTKHGFAEDAANEAWNSEEKELKRAFINDLTGQGIADADAESLWEKGEIE